MSFFHEHLTLLNFYYVVRLLRNTLTMQKAYYGIKMALNGIIIMNYVTLQFFVGQNVFFGHISTRLWRNFTENLEFLSHHSSNSHEIGQF